MYHLNINFFVSYIQILILRIVYTSRFQCTVVNTILMKFSCLWAFFFFWNNVLLGGSCDLCSFISTPSFSHWAVKCHLMARSSDVPIHCGTYVICAFLLGVDYQLHLYPQLRTMVNILSPSCRTPPLPLVSAVCPLCTQQRSNGQVHPLTLSSFYLDAYVRLFQLITHSVSIAS